MLETVTAVTTETLAALEEEKRLRETSEVFLLFPLGSQFDHLIKLALEKIGAYALVADPATISAEDVKKIGPVGIILSGGRASVYADPPPFDVRIFHLGIPVLGICLGFQLWAQELGVTVCPAAKREFGIHALHILDAEAPLLKGCEPETPVLESHGDRIEPHPKLHILAHTENAPAAAARYEHLYGVQFHPETSATRRGLKIFENFCFGICKAQDRYPARAAADKKIRSLQDTIGNQKVLLALSGGSDSAVVAHLLRGAVDERPGQVRAVYIKGLDRPDDEAHVRKYFGNQAWLELRIVDATNAFLRRLWFRYTWRGKRRAVKWVYRAVLTREARRFGAPLIAQGTLYTDLSESGKGYQTGARKAVIKEHHNVLEFRGLKKLEPLADCVKDTARAIGYELGVPEALLTRHPFPGPGLCLRIAGRITRKKLAIEREVDRIWIEELRQHGFYDTVWQAGAVLAQDPVTVTKGDDAGEGYVVVLWAVQSVNGFTAEAAELPWWFIKRVDQRIINEVPAVGETDYKNTGKPPSTIERG